MGMVQVTIYNRTMGPIAAPGWTGVSLRVPPQRSKVFTLTRDRFERMRLWLEADAAKDLLTWAEGNRQTDPIHQPGSHEHRVKTFVVEDLVQLLDRVRQEVIIPLDSNPVFLGGSLTVTDPFTAVIKTATDLKVKVHGRVLLDDRWSIAEAELSALGSPSGYLLAGCGVRANFLRVEVLCPVRQGSMTLEWTVLHV